MTLLDFWRLLLKYGTHANPCRYRGGHDCDCGWEELKKEAEMYRE